MRGCRREPDALHREEARPLPDLFRADAADTRWPRVPTARRPSHHQARGADRGCPDPSQGEGGIKWITISLVTALIHMAPAAKHWQPTPGWNSGKAQPALIAKISQQVFGTHWQAAACIAHGESTDGAHIVNGSSLSPWQINVAAHAWVNAYRVLRDWVYAARVAYRLSSDGTHWSSAWVTTSRDCGLS